MELFQEKHTVLDRKDCTLHRAIEVKLPWLQAVPAGLEWILPLEKWGHFFLGPWLLVCQFIDISNQMESTGEVSNVEQKKLYNGLLFKKILSMFDTSPVVSIWWFTGVSPHNIRHSTFRHRSFRHRIFRHRIFRHIFPNDNIGRNIRHRDFSPQITKVVANNPIQNVAWNCGK